ncbi:RNA recognition motif 2 protein [Besnoitia besnoiti]|uniref:RNA recognition motif 2 protein n=1 Tax=Besnoitia besnoiti TaxID=94643 RepID=A0A2A9MEH0_BESBE|nr:RNA recognition motif 2 protein [Besnoitia besnoiti]PFH34336.1 RNA recognition motif 2 protein [Besnoitia besnoiti]
MGGSIESDPRQHDELRRHLMAQLEYLRSEQGRITQRNVELLQGTECLREQLRHMQRQREIMDRQRLHMEQQLLFMEEQHTTIQQQRAHLGVLQDRIWQKQRELEDLERGPVQIGGATADLAEKFVPVPNGDFLEQAFASFETCASLSTAKQASHEELSRRFCGLYNRLSELSLEDISKRECDTFDERGDCTVAVVDKPNPSCPDSTVFGEADDVGGVEVEEANGATVGLENRAVTDAGSIAIEFARHSGVSLASIADMTKNDAHQFPSPTGETDCNPSVSIAREKEEGDARGQKKKSHGCRSSWRPESANHGTQSGAGAKRKDSLKANTACGSRAINSRGAADEWSGSGAEGLTTVMLRNIPNKYNRKQVMDEVDIKFKGKYNFFYLPIDFVHGCNVGYCFINFVDTGTCQAFKQEFEGKRLNLFRSKKICTVTYGRVQGLRAILDHYFNSAVVQAQDASWRPVVLKEGVEQPWSALHTAFPEIFDSDGRLRSPSGDTAASDSQGSSACSPGRAIGRTLPSGRRRGSKLGVTIEAQRKEMRNLIRGGHHSVHRRVAKGGRSPDRAAWGYKHA